MTDEEYQVPPRRRGLREGYTTGACATAAATAATRALLTGQPVEDVTIHLPIGRDATFHLLFCEIGESSCHTAVVKDAGDDPDVTHGAEIHAVVAWSDEPGLHLKGGVGVGTVTRPGLGLQVGGPAINPVPRRMITEHVSAVAGPVLAERGLDVTISVPNGEELAKKTLNGRLGILGGISILGTTGIVKPWSTASWRASVEQAIDVAVANGERHIVLTTGGRSERFAMAIIPLPEIAFVEMGIFTGKALDRCVSHHVERVTIAGFVGKFAKIAQGHFQTHVAGNQVDPIFLAGLAAACGADEQLVEAIERANTARHAQELVQAAGLPSFFEALTTQVAARSFERAKGRFPVEAILFDFDGSVLARAERDD